MVQQIDHLTSTIDLNEEEEEEEEGTGRESTKPPSDSSYSSGSSSSETTVGFTHQRLSEPANQPETVYLSGTLRGEHHSRSQSPPNVQLRLLSERSRTLHLTGSVGASPKHGGKLPYPSNLTTHDHTRSPQRSLPARPPTPGLSPLTVNFHLPSSSGSQPHSPGATSSIRISSISPPSPLSSKANPPPALSPSVIIQTKVGSYQTTQSDLPSAGPLSPSSNLLPSASCPPTDSETETGFAANTERRASSAGPSHVCAAARGHRGRKPPPYPHHRLSENTKKVKEPRKAPPYPEKRRLLSTTV